MDALTARAEVVETMDNKMNALSSMGKTILPLILGLWLLKITVNVCKLCRNRKVVF
jgi:hypothetical protein